jgi:DNA-directed RNA polymerase subunit RPC12/RpoP
MTTRQFACPRCSGRFLVDIRAAAQALACPHCGREVAIPPGSTDTAEEVPQSEPGGESPSAPEPFVPFDFRDAPPAPPASESKGRAGAKLELDDLVPGLVPNRRAARRRRAQRSLIVMLICLAVLAAAVVLASRF